jgi:hypothetical protein
MYQKFILPVTALILLVVNCFVIFTYDLEASRYARLTSTLILFLILLWKNSYSIKVLFAFLVLLISDVLFLNFANSIASTGTILLRVTAYLLIVSAILPELKDLKSSLFQKFFFVLVFLLNLAMLIMLVDMVPNKFGYPFLNVLFYAYGLAMIIMVIASISYSNRFSNNVSFYYTAGTLALVLSDVSSFIAYYLEFYEFYFSDRIFYILGIAGLVKFTTFARSQEVISEL